MEAAPRWRGLAEASAAKKAHERRAAASDSLSIFIDPHPLWFVEAGLIGPIRARMGHSCQGYEYIATASSGITIAVGASSLRRCKQ